MFDHERLRVYQQAIGFTAWSEELLNEVSPKISACDQLDRASTSMPINIAEGNGRYRAADRCRFFDIARGSALESASCLDVLVAKRRVDPERVARGKAMLEEIVSMLVGLIRSNSDRVCEPERPHYDTSAALEGE
jgi:four helix bundle protein